MIKDVKQTSSRHHYYFTAAEKNTWQTLREEKIEEKEIPLVPWQLHLFLCKKQEENG